MKRAGILFLGFFTILSLLEVCGALRCAWNITMHIFGVGVLKRFPFLLWVCPFSIFDVY